MSSTLWVPAGVFVLGMLASAMTVVSRHDDGSWLAIAEVGMPDLLAVGAVVALPVAALSALEINSTMRSGIIMVAVLTAALYGVFRFDPFGMTRVPHYHRHVT